MREVDFSKTSTADMLLQVLDKTRELQEMTAGRNLEMLRYLLNMVEHETEAMLMSEHEDLSSILNGEFQD